MCGCGVGRERIMMMVVVMRMKRRGKSEDAVKDRRRYGFSSQLIFKFLTSRQRNTSYYPRQIFRHVSHDNGKNIYVTHELWVSKFVSMLSMWPIGARTHCMKMEQTSHLWKAVPHWWKKTGAANHWLCKYNSSQWYVYIHFYFLLLLIPIFPHLTHTW